MKIVFDFSVVENVRPSDTEACLFILKDKHPEVLVGNYYKDRDFFHVDEMNEYSADEVLYWAKNAL